MIEVSDVKNSLRIDHNLDDTLIDLLIETAADYIISAIDAKAERENIEKYQQFNWAVSLLTQHWYEKRDTANSDRMPVTVQALIQQMRGAYYATH
ncbi:head-tail connector protein [Enterococcus sp. AZ109]|uniref:head-tail connector protein n=1 Tax=Enterococcus sp. AZ109 TaxID=2774634 RepID=UPI003F1E5E74